MITAEPPMDDNSKLRFEIECRKGTTFFIRLPIATQVNEAGKIRAAA